MSGQDTTEKTDLPSRCIASLLKHCAALWNSSCNNSLLQRTSIRFKLVTNTLFLVALPTLDDTFATLACHVSLLFLERNTTTHTLVWDHIPSVSPTPRLSCAPICSYCSHMRQSHLVATAILTVLWQKAKTTTTRNETKLCPGYQHLC